MAAFVPGRLVLCLPLLAQALAKGCLLCKVKACQPSLASAASGPNWRTRTCCTSVWKLAQAPRALVLSLGVCSTQAAACPTQAAVLHRIGCVGRAAHGLHFGSARLSSSSCKGLGRSRALIKALQRPQVPQAAAAPCVPTLIGAEKAIPNPRRQYRYYTRLTQQRVPPLPTVFASA